MSPSGLSFCVISCLHVCSSVQSSLPVMLKSVQLSPELARPCCISQGIHLDPREGRLHNGEDRRRNEGALCTPVKRMIYSETHITQDPESPKAWGLPLFFAVGNDVSPLTMDVLCECLWNVCHHSRDRETERTEAKGRIWFVTSGLFDTCLPLCYTLLSCLQ